jgi:hypothetical protein
MLRVVRICIKVPSRCRSVKRAAGRSLLRPPTLSYELDDPDGPVGRTSPNWGPVLRQHGIRLVGEDPREAISPVKLGPCRRSFVHSELLAQG